MCTFMRFYMVVKPRTYVAMFYIWVKLMYLYGIWYLEFASEVCYLLRILQKWELFEQCCNVTRIFDVYFSHALNLI